MSSEKKCIFDFVELTSRIKKDPKSHEENFDTQYTHFELLCSLLEVDVTQNSTELSSLITFISVVIHYYKPYIPRFIGKLSDIIKLYGKELEPCLRLNICKVILKQKVDKNMNDIEVFRLIIGLFGCNDKILRKNLQHMIIANVKNTNKRHYNNKLNTAIQTQFFQVLQKPFSNEHYQTYMAVLNILIALWRKNVWRNDRVVNMISYVCFYDHFKLSFTAIKFFLGQQKSGEDSDGSDSECDEHEQKKLNALMLIKKSKSDTQPTISRTSRKRKRKLEKALEYVEKVEKKKKARSDENAIGDTQAIRALNDPQTFAEKLLKGFKKSRNTLEYRLTILEVVSRVISVHQLVFLNYYSLIQRYLQAHQTGAVRILTSLVQACHKYVPDEYVFECVKTIANNFISQHSASEISAVGMNTIREICWRCPNAIDEALAQELVGMRRHSANSSVDKVLSVASKSLLQVIRVVNPKLLMRKDRVRSKLTELVNDFPDSNIVMDTIPGVSNPTSFHGSTELSDQRNRESQHKNSDISDFSDDCENEFSDEDSCNAEIENECSDEESCNTNSENEVSGITNECVNELQSDVESDDCESDECTYEDTFEEDSDDTDMIVSQIDQDTLASRFLTDEEFKMLRKRNIRLEADKMEKMLSRNSNKNYSFDSNMDENYDNNTENVLPLEKVGFVAGLKKKHAREDLLKFNKSKYDKKKEKQEESSRHRDKVFNSWRFNTNASKTKAEKKKSKPFMMIKHKKQVKGKAKKSYREKVATIKKTLKAAKNMRH